MKKERRTNWEDYGEFLKTHDLQEILGLSKESIQKMIHEPGFPKIRLSGGRVYIYPKSALAKYFHEKALGA
jgi:hypothetical protein